MCNSMWKKDSMKCRIDEMHYVIAIVTLAMQERIEFKTKDFCECEKSADGISFGTFFSNSIGCGCIISETQKQTVVLNK